MVSLSLAKQHLEYESDDRDTLITQYIGAATAWVENYTGKKLSLGAVVQSEDCFGDYIQLQSAPFVSLTSIQYIDTDNAPQVVTGAKVLNGRIYAPDGGWPSKADYSPVTVTYQAGYATVPADLVSAELLLIGHWFENREAVNVGNITSELPFAVEAICRPHRALLV
jgi:uncharacterized phiE125 gp8 family phage protein